MKKAVFFLCIVLLAFSYVVYKEVGNTSSVEVSIGKSARFSETEINDAVKQVKGKFHSFTGCTLKKIWYDEERSNKLVSAYMKYGKGIGNCVKPENVIVLLSSFDVGSSGGDGSLEPNSTYSDWSWTLIRDEKTTKWKVDAWGY